MNIPNRIFFLQGCTHCQKFDFLMGPKDTVTPVGNGTFTKRRNQSLAYCIPLFTKYVDYPVVYNLDKIIILRKNDSISSVITNIAFMLLPLLPLYMLCVHSQVSNLIIFLFFSSLSRITSKLWRNWPQIWDSLFTTFVTNASLSYG